MRSQTFAVVGLGLLGGSLGGALRKAFPKCSVIGVSRSRAKIKAALRKRFITSGTTNLKSAVQDANFVIICTPVDTIANLVFKIDSFAKRGTWVTDVGSAKHEIIEKIRKRRLNNIHFIGAHPMAGSHLTGLAHADPHLYRNAFVFVTKHAGMNQAAFKQVTALWKKICAKTVVINTKSHDEIVAEISHIPHFFAALLVDACSDRSLPFAGPGFKDITRVAQGDPRLWVPIFLANRSNIQKRLTRISKRLKSLQIFLQSGQTRQISAFLEKSAFRRHKIS